VRGAKPSPHTRQTTHRPFTGPPARSNAARLEDVGVIGRESNAERDVERRPREIADVYALVADATPDKVVSVYGRA